MARVVDLLVVDDDDGLRAQLREFLVRRGLRVETSATAYDALSAIEKQPPRVLLTDIYMPDMDGIELIRAVRIKSPEMKIVAMSGEFMWLEPSRKLGADATLEKPFSNAALWQIVSSLLGES